MSTLTIRRADARDADTLLPLMNAFNQHEGIQVDPALHRGALMTLLDSEELGRVWLVEATGGVVGYAVLTFNYDLEYAGRDAFLTELYLVPTARGAGHGRDLLAQIEQAARALDVKAIHLMVRPENTLARRLYAGCGYEPPARITLGKELTQ